jgi:hypothetical protein
MSTEPDQIAEWRCLLDRIENEQLSDLLINHHIFKHFNDCITPCADTYRAGELARWMAQNYVAFVTTTIRKMVEPWKKNRESISLVILLEQLEQNNTLLTREWFRQLYENSVDKRFADRAFAEADRAFAEIAGDATATIVPVARIERDIEDLKDATKDITTLVNKVIAHTKEDRRKVPLVRFGQLGKAIDLLHTTFRRYRLLLNGNGSNPIVPLNYFDCVKEDLKLIWPPR